DLGSNPGEDIDVCKCIVPSRQEGTLNSRRAESPLVWSVEGLAVAGANLAFPKREVCCEEDWLSVSSAMNVKQHVPLPPPINTGTGTCFPGRYSPTYRSADPMRRHCMGNPGVSLQRF
ncbi:POU domain protein, partial [Trichonephila clavipes]